MALTKREAMQGFGRPTEIHRNAEYVHEDKELDLGNNPAEVIELSDYRRPTVDEKDVDTMVDVVSEGVGKLDNYLRLAVNNYLTESFGITDGVEKNKIARAIIGGRSAAAVLEKYNSRFETAKLQYQRDQSQEGFRDLLPELMMDLEVLLSAAVPKMIKSSKTTVGVSPVVIAGASSEVTPVEEPVRVRNVFQRAGKLVKEYFGFVSDEDVK